MIRSHRRAAAAIYLIVALAAASLGSCSSRLGWGVVLWTSSDGSLPAGSIVPVYIKSNIEKVYVVGVANADNKDRNKKVEVPLWQLELLSSKGKAEAFVKSMGENVSLYMSASRNRVPVLDAASSSSGRTVFRLREGESVKILEKVKGESVTTGGKLLSGSWYRVLANDGTSGYAFSYAFRIYDESKEGPPVLAAEKPALSGRVDLVFSRSWRPEYFQDMLSDDRVDLDYFLLRYGIFVDGIRKQIRIELPAASKVFTYKGIVESKGLYLFEGSSLSIKIESDTRMLCSWASPSADSPAAEVPDIVGAAAITAAASATLADPSSFGAAGSAAFVVLPTEPRDAIRQEILRRQKLLGNFADEVGSSWTGEGLGKLVINKNGRFIWAGRETAAAAFAPASSGNSGEIAFRLYLEPSLSATWQGVLSLRFDPSVDAAAPVSSFEGEWIDFLYRKSPAGLVLAPASESNLVAAPEVGRTDNLILTAASE